MAEEAPLTDAYPHQGAEDPAARTFLGGTSFGTRVGLFLILGILLIAGAGGVLYHADMLAGATMDRVAEAQRVRELVSEVEAGTRRVQADSRSFVVGRNPDLADNYEARIQPVLDDLNELLRHPAAQDVSRHVTTINDGVAQLASQFSKVVGVQRIIGVGGEDGLIQLVGNSGAALEARLAAMGAAALLKELGELRQMDIRLRAGNRPVPQAQITKTIEAFKRQVGAADYPSDDRQAVRQLADAYGEDLSQLASSRQALSREIDRLDEILGYVAPSLEALATFSHGNLASAVAAQSAVRGHLRQMVAGGVGGALVLLVVVGLVLMSSIARPTARLAAAAARLAHGDRGVTIPALGNYDEAGEIANALTYFRENIAQTDRLRKELEDHLSRAAADLAAEESEPEIEEEAEVEAPVPAARPATAAPGSAITELSRMVAQTSQHASLAAYEAERTDVMVAGLKTAGKKIVEVDRLMSEIRDQSGLLAVQASVDGGGDQNLIVLPSKSKSSGEPMDNSMSIEARVESIQTRTKRAMDLVREVGQVINEVNNVAVEFAAETSTQALEAATELLRQSEDLRGTLDKLLERIRPEDRRSAPGRPEGN